MTLRLHRPDPDDAPGPRDLVSALEVPDCGCRALPVPVCVVARGPQGCRPQCVRPGAEPHKDRRGRLTSGPLGCQDRCEDGACACPKAPCDCPLYPGAPCRHVRARDHAMSPDRWAALLEQYGDAGPADFYGPAALPETPGRALTRADLIALYARRAARGQALFHPDDVTPAGQARLGEAASRGANGAAGRGALRLAFAGDDDQPPAWDVAWLTWARYRERWLTPARGRRATLPPRKAA